MGKDNCWFKHDSDAGRSIKLRKVQHIYGHEGKGIYWDVVEFLREQDEYCHEMDDSSMQMICDLIGHKDHDRFISWFQFALSLGLFSVNDQDKFYCPALNNRMKVLNTKKENGGKGGRPIKAKTESETQKKTESKPKAKPKRNHKIRIDKIRLDKIIEKEKETVFALWINYRQEIKKPIKSESTLKSLADKFNSVSLEQAEWVVNSSISNGWVGLFWEKYIPTAKNSNIPVQ